MIYKFFLFFFIIFSSIYADRAPVNMVIAYDPFIVPRELFAGEHVQFSLYGECGARNGYALNRHGDRVNPLSLWNDVENVVTMLDGVSNNSEITDLRNLIGTPKTQNSGKIQLFGEFKEKFSIVLALKAQLVEYVYFALYFPCYRYELNNITFHDFTGTDFSSDRLIKSEITDHLADTVQRLGNLDISPWSRSGTGDVTIALEWYRTFRQNRPILKAVSTQIHGGLTLPTARRADVNKLLAFSFGSNGAFAIPFGAAIDLQYGPYFHCGLDVLLIHTFAVVEKRRIKTSLFQTELLLLNVAETYTDFGLTQRFMLYASLKDLIPHVSCMVGYYFEKQGDDVIYVRGNEFQTSIAQTAFSLDDRTMHQCIGTFGYEQLFCEHAISASFVTRIPFNGKRVLLVPTVGISITYAF